MKRSTGFLLFVFGSLLGYAQDTLLSPSEFTAACAASFRQTEPDLQVEVVGDLQLKVTSSLGHTSGSFLDNAYTQYLQDPTAKEHLIHRMIRSALESNSTDPGKPDPSTIVPVIKDRPWLEEVRRSILERGDQPPELVYESLNDELVIIYAQDLPVNIQYLEPSAFRALGLDTSALRALACGNLERRLPSIERHVYNGTYMLTAGGNYEASLILLDFIWTDSSLVINGEPVFAIPSRDLLFITGSLDEEGLSKVRELAAEASVQGAYRLTPQLFVRRNGRIEKFSDAPK